MTRPTRHHPAIPDADDRVALNAALHATGADTGFCDNHGRPAPWPDDIEEWRPTTSEPLNHQPGEVPY
jgi:hypothetical protein